MGNFEKTLKRLGELLFAIVVIAVCISAIWLEVNQHKAPDIPVYPDAEQVQKTTEALDGQGCPGASLSFVARAQPEEIYDFYSDMLDKTGWQHSDFCGGFYWNTIYGCNYVARVHTNTTEAAMTKTTVTLFPSAPGCE